MSNEDYENDPVDFVSHLRTVIILAARKSSSLDIDIAAVDKIVEITTDFVKNILEQMAIKNDASLFSSADLLNAIRINNIFSSIKGTKRVFQLQKNLMVFLKPESALKRAEQLIDVGKKQHALETLLEVIKSRRHRTWTKSHEPLMEKFLDLCIDLKKVEIAKDGLHQYRTMTQTISVKSLEDVILKFLAQGEERCSYARKDATSASMDIDDLEVIQTPESLLLSAVSGDSQQDRRDRDMIAPWLRFLWDCYKQCLELLKNNNRVEKVYHEVVRLALRFCHKYNRRPEFRKLGDIIRTHLMQSQKFIHQANNIDIQSSETQILHLETRLLQLDIAIDMEFWQEAFKAIQDIHELTILSKRPPKPQQLAAYYNKAALVFWKVGNYIFHAASVLKVYVLHKEQKKNITQSELSDLSIKALLAILSIPLPTPRTQVDEHLDVNEGLSDKQKRVASILSLQEAPTRASLIRDMIKQGVLNFVPPELKVMYDWLEVEFHPLHLSEKIEEILLIERFSQPEYSQYLSSLREVTVVRLLQQISQVYQTITLERFISLAPPMNRFHLEKIMVNAVKNNDVQLRLDHKLQALVFDTDLNASMRKSVGIDAGSKANIFQQLPNEKIRKQLTSFSHALYSCMDIVNEKSNKERTNKLKQEIAAAYFCDEPTNHRELLKRREIIERYKEDQEKRRSENLRRAETLLKSERNEREKEDEVQREAELKRRQMEAQLEKEREEHRFAMKIVIDRLRETEIGRKTIEVIGEEELYKLEPNSLNSKHIDTIIKQNREQKEKLKIQHKKVDYVIRALHEAEIPLLIKYAEEEMIRRREIQQHESQMAKLKAENLMKMKDDRNEFLKRLRARRHEEHIQQKRIFEERLTYAREEKLKQLRQNYIEERKEQFRRERELKQEKEKERQIEAEKERQNKELLEKKRQDEEEKRNQLDRQMKKQREREAEIEEKLNAIQEPSHRHSPFRRGGRPEGYSGSAHYKEKSRTEETYWPRGQRDDDRESSQTGTHLMSRPRNDEQGSRGPVNDRRPDVSASSRRIHSDRPWRSKPEADLQNRDERREPPSQQLNPSHTSTTDRYVEANSDASDNWQTVTRKHSNTPRADHNRPVSHRFDEMSSGTSMQSSTRMSTEPRVEHRDIHRNSPRSSNNFTRSNENSGGRQRERRFMNNWRAGDDVDSERNRSETGDSSSHDSRRNINRQATNNDDSK